jgi:2-isopropylmalate synthase
MSDERVLIFDTTLRDGEQAPGCSMNIEEKLVLAKQLARLGVRDKAGFDRKGRFRAVRAVARYRGDDLRLARAETTAPEGAGGCRRPHPRHRHRDPGADKLQMSRSRALKGPRALEASARYADDVEFSAETLRARLGLLVRVYTRVSFSRLHAERA